MELVEDSCHVQLFVVVVVDDFVDIGPIPQERGLAVLVILVLLLQVSEVLLNPFFGCVLLDLLLVYRRGVFLLFGLLFGHEPVALNILQRRFEAGKGEHVEVVHAFVVARVAMHAA